VSPVLSGLNSTTGGTGQTLLKTSKVSNPKEYPKLINRNINHISLQQNNSYIVFTPIPKCQLHKFLAYGKDYSLNFLSMKKDLSSMLVQGGKFNSVEELKDYLVEYVLELILIELENLPKDQWDKTLKTWEKIVLLSYGMMGKPLEEREKLYERWRFDAVMKTIVENLAEALRESLRLGLLKEKQEPRKLLQVALQHALNKGHPKKKCSWK
jgi:hypothetical protein